MIDIDLYKKIQSGEIDPNNQSLFFSILYKAFIYDLNNMLSLRGSNIPHFLLNTGDDIMYLENKGQDYSIEPFEVSNENYIYNTIPRCILELGNVEVLADQLTSPYSLGCFDMEYNDMIYSFVAEFRRIPIKTSISGKYYFSSLTDCLDVTQQIISNLMFIRNFRFSYLGQTILASYAIPSNVDREINIQFDEGSSDNRYRVMTLDYTLETNLPIFYNKTCINRDDYIRTNSNSILCYERQGIANNKHYIDKIDYEIK